MSKPTSCQELIEESLSTALGMVVLLLIGWFFAGKGHVASQWTFGISIIAFISFTILFLVHALSPGDLEAELGADGEVGSFQLVVAPSLLMGSFLLSSFSMWKIWGTDAFSGGTSNPVTWLAYLLDNIVRAAFLDFAEIFNVDLSPIDHSSQFLVCFFVFTFRTTISVALISVVVRTWMMLRARA